MNVARGEVLHGHDCHREIARPHVGLIDRVSDAVELGDRHLRADAIAPLGGQHVQRQRLGAVDGERAQPEADALGLGVGQAPALVLDGDIDRADAWRRGEALQDGGLAGDGLVELADRLGTRRHRGEEHEAQRREPGRGPPAPRLPASAGLVPERLGLPQINSCFQSSSRNIPLAGRQTHL